MNSIFKLNFSKSLLLIFMVMNWPATSAAQTPQDEKPSPHYYERLEIFKKESPILPGEFVMLGNSLTENAGNWNKRLQTTNVRNRGIIGDTAFGIYNRLASVLEGHPQRIYLMAGINDVSHNLSAKEIVRRIRLIIKRIKEVSPTTEIYLQSLLPINESFQRYRLLNNKTNLIPIINASLKRLSQRYNLHYIDLFPLFTEPNSLILRKELTTDGLHLNEEGYNIWINELKKTIHTEQNINEPEH